MRETLGPQRTIWRCQSAGKNAAVPRCWNESRFGPLQSVTTPPVSGWILKAGMALSLCIRPYLTFPFAPSSASTACTCSTKVPVGWFSSTEACSRYCWHWNGEKEGGGRGEMSKSTELFSRVRIRGVGTCFISEGKKKTGSKKINSLRRRSLQTLWEVPGIERNARATDAMCCIHRNGRKTLQLISFEAAAVKGFCLSQESNPFCLMNICPR